MADRAMSMMRDKAGVGARQGRVREARQVLQQALLHAGQPQRRAVVALRLIVRAPQRILALSRKPHAMTPLTLNLKHDIVCIIYQLPSAWKAGCMLLGAMRSPKRPP